MNICGRCGWQDREPRVRQTIANLEREARRDGRPFAGEPFAIEYRCQDREACAQRMAQGTSPRETA